MLVEAKERKKKKKKKGPVAMATENISFSQGVCM